MLIRQRNDRYTIVRSSPFFFFILSILKPFHFISENGSVYLIHTPSTCPCDLFCFTFVTEPQPPTLYRSQRQPFTLSWELETFVLFISLMLRLRFVLFNLSLFYVNETKYHCHLDTIQPFICHYLFCNLSILS